MSEPYIGEIRMFGGNFAPVGWNFCDGSILPIAEYEALFTLIGTTYGGDGQTTFAVPDLRGRIPLHFGSLPGGPNYVIGQAGGSETRMINMSSMPSHSHALGATTTPATTSTPGAGVILAKTSATLVYTNETAASAPMAPAALSPAPGNMEPYPNMMPFLPLSFIISLFGIYPSQN